MEEYEQEIFRQILVSEVLASEEDIRAVFVLAEELVDNSEPEYCQARRVYDEETEAELNIVLSGDSYYFDEDSLPPNVKIMFSRADEDGYAFCIEYGPNNDYENLEVPSEDQIHLVTEICDDLLMSGNLSPAEHKVVDFYNKALTNQLDESLKDSGDNFVSIPDLIRQYMREIYGDKMIVSTEREIENESKSATICQYLPVGSWDGTEHELDEIPFISVAYSDVDSMISYVIEMDRDGFITFDTGLVDPVDSPIVAEYMQDIIDSEQEDWGLEAEISKPTTNQIEEILEILVSGSVLEVEEEPLVRDFIYPELPFGIVIRLNEDEKIVSVRSLTNSALNAISKTIKFVLPNECTEGFPEQPNYSFNENKLKRIDNFLNSSVSAKRGKETETKKRKYVVDLPAIYEKVLDELSEVNHPISQLVLQLYEDFSNNIEMDDFDEVVFNILKITQWNKIRRIVNQEIEQWRSVSALN